MNDESNTRVSASTAIELLQDEIDRGNDGDLGAKTRFMADGEPIAVEVRVGQTPVFELPIGIGAPLPRDIPATAPNPEVETIKSNILGWLNLALKEAARLNVEGRYGVCDRAMTAIQLAAKDVRRYVC